MKIHKPKEINLPFSSEIANKFPSKNRDSLVFELMCIGFRYQEVFSDKQLHLLYNATDFYLKEHKDSETKTRFKITNEVSAMCDFMKSRTSRIGIESRKGGGCSGSKKPKYEIIQDLAFFGAFSLFKKGELDLPMPFTDISKLMGMTLEGVSEWKEKVVEYAKYGIVCVKDYVAFGFVLESLFLDSELQQKIFDESAELDGSTGNISFDSEGYPNFNK